jgi:hypothetical protein
MGSIQTPSGNTTHCKPNMLVFQVQNKYLESTYNPHSYLLQGQGVLCTLMRPWIHANSLYICLTIAD